MPDLIAQGTEPRHRWRRPLIAHVPVTLGRSAGTWDVPWDQQISRQHAQLIWNGDALVVTQIPTAHNPIFMRGEQCDQCELRLGEHFVIGATTFSLVDQKIDVRGSERPSVSEQAFTSTYLQDLRYRDADHRIEVLSRLPELIQSAASDQELFVRLVSFLLAGIPRADTAAVVAVNSAATSTDPVRVMYWDSQRSGARQFSPSSRLICTAVNSDQSVLTIWRGTQPQQAAAFTQQDDEDWAFCTPVLGEACRGWAIYVAGRLVPEPGASPVNFSPDDLRDDLKFSELTATTLRSLMEVRSLQQTRLTLRQFLSPVVVDALVGRDPEQVLTPRETDVSVLFCDLRGFSRQSEREASDLLGLLERVSDALGVMTHHILERGGVVGDFHGDAAMGFWGWPLEQPAWVERAARAALDIRATFAAAAAQADHPLAGFRIGIGLATGRAVAGKIGTVDQVKVTVFGPVVNVASRLESMTRALHAPILVDAATAQYVRQHVPASTARVRRVATVRPYGMNLAVEVSELLPPEAEYSILSSQHIANYEAALNSLQAGDWELAFEQLHTVPAEDRVKDFLTMYIVQNNRVPPPDWDGVIPLTGK